MKFTKEQFVKALKTYQTMYYEENRILDTLNINPEWTLGSWIGNYYDLLIEVCELTDDYWIDGTPLDWFCYEWEFGIKGDAGVYEPGPDGKEVRRPLDTPERLYDYICEFSPYRP